jgi:lipopolysaccharide transport system ATP-binding protein
MGLIMINGQNPELAIKIENLSKKFCLNLKRSMFYGTLDIFRNMFGIPYRLDILRKTEFWVLDGIDFEIKKGESFGLIGANGSGKSTLLRLITGIFPPDQGKIYINGRIGALIAVGAGFHPYMTGRENIFLNGTILGMSKNDIIKNFDSIVNFAEIGDFLDAPVSTYSSGMYVRLGFAIAIHSRPDIMLVDEVLAVGDVKFQRKCLDKIRELRKKGTTFIIVSHNMQNIEGACSKVVLLRHGKQIALGPPKDIVPIYELMLKTGEVPSDPIVNINKITNGSYCLRNVRKYEGFGTDEVEILSIRLLDNTNQPKLDFISEEALAVEARVKSNTAIKDAKLWVSFIYINDYDKDEENLVCLGTRENIDIKQGESIIKLHFNSIQLTTGEYKIAFNLFDETFTNPYSQGHYGYFTVKKGIPTMLSVGIGTPTCWANPNLEVINV